MATPTPTPGSSSPRASTRDTRYVTTRITAEGGDGFPVEPGRYRLVVSRACPWANRAIIVRRLLGLEGVLSMTLGRAHPRRAQLGVHPRPGRQRPGPGQSRGWKAYLAPFADHDRGVTVPAIVDIPTGQLVTNDDARLTLDLSTEWKAFHRPGSPDLYPESRRDEVDEAAELVFRDSDNGVYRCGFAATQNGYERSH